MPYRLSFYGKIVLEIKSPGLHLSGQLAFGQLPLEYELLVTLQKNESGNGFVLKKNQYTQIQELPAE